MPRPRATDPPLGPAVFHILLALGDGALNGYQITQQVAENSNGAVTLSPATLYENLHRLAAASLTAEIDPPAEEADGRGQRFCELSDAGVDLLRQEVERLGRDLAVARSVAALKSGR
ncbi:MAG: PadR family transcriptional regulator [Acidobacteria bacterium]|nr:PadR family transcriptional regulator [Acidobacteriota bacterium]